MNECVTACQNNFYPSPRAVYLSGSNTRGHSLRVVLLIPQGWHGFYIRFVLSSIRFVMRFFLCCLLIACATTGYAADSGREYYRISIFTFSTENQERLLDRYFEQAYLPALHRAGISRVGVFKPLANDTASQKHVYVIAAFQNQLMGEETDSVVAHDPIHLSIGKDFLDAAWNAPPYDRLQVQWLKAFALAPTLQKPALKGLQSDHIYEYRSYEGPTEAYYRNKVDMFNGGGEIALFERLTFHAVFYGEVIAGNRMPNLVYMTSFDNIASRDEHWKMFSDDPEWKKLVAMEKYQHNVSKADIILMKAAPYSDF